MASLRMKMHPSQSSVTLFTRILLVFLIPSADTKFLQGHGMQLGKHKDPIGHLEILEKLPSSREFWENYAAQRKPVVFRGAAQLSKGMHLWTDDYLMENFGDLKVKIESKSEKENIPTGVKGLGQDTIASFLRSYQSRNAYIVSQLPQPMASGVSVLPFLTCGTFVKRILEANLWMSSGGTKSLLHRDADNAINCLYAGTKDWIFIHPSFEDHIPIAKEDFKAYGGFALLDPDNVDLDKYPSFTDVDWTYANLTAGDCLYLPYGYWHQVRSYGTRNMAVSVLFSRLNDVDLSDCNDKSQDFIPLTEINMVFTYDGYENQTMGDTDPYELNETLIEWCHLQGMLDHSSLMESLLEEFGLDFSGENKFQETTVNSQHFDEDVLKERVKESLENIANKLMDILDANQDGKLVCDKELNALPLKTLTTLANILDGDSGNTEDHEFFSFTPDEIRDFLLTCMNEAEAHSNGELHKADFLTSYQEYGGSKKGGIQVYSILDSGNDNIISRKEVDANIEKVLLMFRKSLKSSLAEMEKITTENKRNTVDRENELRNKQHRNQQSHEDL
ncbi:uncharacterized protein [Asterias amurensis]|uniref:uncharacterized protein n=1 Tax=Asterias amurensis TaxID=7602 RepID=UPI003AB211CB